MKKLVLIAFAALATSAFAGDPVINIIGTSTQSTSMILGATLNTSSGIGARAVQNLASNSGTIEISGNSNQSVAGRGAIVANSASGAFARATQNLASNYGEVNIVGDSNQSVGLTLALVSNQAGAGTVAVQNVSSNNACVTCQ
ncbi:MAG: hypothetical protein JWR68_85 [Polaromonas sp.]|nr:hypothetical protein [Polaromonas sp.]